MDPSKHMATPVKTNMDQATLVSMLNFWGAHVPTWGNDDSSEAPPSAPGLPCQRSSKQHMHRPEATKVEFSICTKRGFSLTAGLVWLVGWLGWLVGLDWWLSWVGWLGASLLSRCRINGRLAWRHGFVEKFTKLSPQHWMGVLSQWTNKDSWNPCFNIQLFLQQSWKWFRKVPGKLGSSTVGSCSTQIHWTHTYKKHEISTTDFKNQCFGSRYPTIFLTFHPLATWNYHLSCVHLQDFPTKTT